jgi:glutamine phosphoribosylpyrophosphate amidotransferase|tara:strand:- start:1689 stop:2423 length:735 start_codon:yes stop_codon:yes gene_type:complete
MCGIFAASIQDIGSDQIETIKKILIETEIRGKHASGISWFSEGKVHTIKASKPISELLEEFDIYRCVDENNGHLSMIAHIRYSTSDANNNQPIIEPVKNDNGDYEFNNDGGVGDFSIVHNGIITQSDPSTWEDLFGLGQTYSSNDSELVYNSFNKGLHPLKELTESSMAVATIDKRGMVHAFRNGSRPMWLTKTYNGIIATSTSDIITRSGFEYSSHFKSIPGVDYNLSMASKEVIVKNMEDLQ